MIANQVNIRALRPSHTDGHAHHPVQVGGIPGLFTIQCRGLLHPSTRFPLAIEPQAYPLPHTYNPSLVHPLVEPLRTLP
jgi:hypothetical protein